MCQNAVLCGNGLKVLHNIIEKPNFLATSYSFIPVNIFYTLKNILDWIYIPGIIFVSMFNPFPFKGILDLSIFKAFQGNKVSKAKIMEFVFSPLPHNEAF